MAKVYKAKTGWIGHSVCLHHVCKNLLREGIEGRRESVVKEGGD